RTRAGGSATDGLGAFPALPSLGAAHHDWYSSVDDRDNPSGQDLAMPSAASSFSAPLRLLVLGAHPDDCEYHAGGLAAIYRRAGHAVKMVSVTNGQSGHFRISGEPL